MKCRQTSNQSNSFPLVIAEQNRSDFKRLPLDAPGAVPEQRPWNLARSFNRLINRPLQSILNSESHSTNGQNSPTWNTFSIFRVIDRNNQRLKRKVRYNRSIIRYLLWTALLRVCSAASIHPRSVWIMTCRFSCFCPSLPLFHRIHPIFKLMSRTAPLNRASSSRETLQINKFHLYENELCWRQVDVYIYCPNLGSWFISLCKSLG